MKLQTKYFGEIEIDDDKVIDFDEGIPGFHDDTKFVLITEENENEEDEKTVITWMQSACDKNICFALIDASAIYPDYNPLVGEDEISGLGELEDDSLLIYNSARFTEDVKQSTVNLKAPVVVNLKKKKGKQVICANEDYQVRRKLFNE